ncbi:MAG TPA: hypothetical protein EYP59_09320 [Thiotrichaceae bacterium]|nr:hypothetical protein [Thiotrichaceae bacterium]
METLLALSGIKDKVKLAHHAEWIMITQSLGGFRSATLHSTHPTTIKLAPEIRYDKIGSRTKQDAINMLNSVKTLLKIL